MTGQASATLAASLGPQSRTLSVHVLATTKEGTACALASAKRLVDGLDARVVLLLPRLTRFGWPVDLSAEERTTLIDQYRTLAADVGVHVIVLFCVCQRYDDLVHQMLGPYSLLIVGGRKRTRWPTREERLVGRLSAEGYPVVFAQVSAEPDVRRAPLVAS
jgi:hypothetical protein